MLFGLAVLAVNILLSVTDQFGRLDLATMLVDGGLAVLLTLTRGLYTRA